MPIMSTPQPGPQATGAPSDLRPEARFQPEAGRVSVRGLTKRFGEVLAVDNLSFDVRPGRVTGFLGPNGAGKTTTLRMLLGLVTPTAGTAAIGGRDYRSLPAPQRVVGAALEASSFHPGRTARDHLRVFARTAGVPDSRADELLALVGLSEAAGRRAGGFSLGMRQRLALATALLGDPQVLLLDEPANGLDPEGIFWLRGFLRYLASEGRTVLVSSHVLSEVQQTVDDVVIINRGRLVRQAPLAELEQARATTVVAGPDAGAVERALRAAGWEVVQLADGAPGQPGRFRVLDAEPAAVGHALFTAGVELHELAKEASGLESVFFQLTGEETGEATGQPVPETTAGAGTEAVR
jgi:ABC-2 type transport system ATP-binding protein